MALGRLLVATYECPCHFLFTFAAVVLAQLFTLVMECIIGTESCARLDAFDLFMTGIVGVTLFRTSVAAVESREAHVLAAALRRQTGPVGRSQHRGLVLVQEAHDWHPGTYCVRRLYTINFWSLLVYLWLKIF
jgi:hypothetical protein